MPIFCIGFPCKLATASVLVPFSTVVGAAMKADAEIVVGIQDLSNSDPKVVDFISNQPKTRVFHATGCSNLSSNLNFIIGKSRSRYFIRTDDDDLMHPNRVVRLDKIIRDGTRFAILGQAYKCFSSNHVGPVIAPACNSIDNKIRLLLGVPFGHPAITIDLSIVGNSPYDTNQTYAQDYMLYVDAINKGPFLGDGQLATYYCSPIYRTASQMAKRRKQLEDHEKAMYKIWNKVFPSRLSKQEIHYIRAKLVTSEFSNLDSTYSMERCREMLERGIILLRGLLEGH
jgi:hypothetical protein